MLRKENRICLDKEFDRVFKTGQSFYGKDLGIKTIANSLEYTRFGILVGLKVSKKAVARNLLKRRIRAIISKEIPLLKPGVDIVIITLPLILGKKFEEIEKSLKIGFKRLHLYK